MSIFSNIGNRIDEYRKDSNRSNVDFLGFAGGFVAGTAVMTYFMHNHGKEIIGFLGKIFGDAFTQSKLAKVLTEMTMAIGGGLIAGGAGVVAAEVIPTGKACLDKGTDFVNKIKNNSNSVNQNKM
jgi:hypothetical protein